MTTPCLLPCVASSLTASSSFPAYLYCPQSEPFFIDVDALQEQGISMQDIIKLKGAGFATIKGVQQGKPLFLSLEPCQRDLA